MLRTARFKLVFLCWHSCCELGSQALSHRCPFSLSCQDVTKAPPAGGVRVPSQTYGWRHSSSPETLSSSV